MVGSNGAVAGELKPVRFRYKFSPGPLFPEYELSHKNSILHLWHLLCKELHYINCTSIGQPT